MKTKYIFLESHFNAFNGNYTLRTVEAPDKGRVPACIIYLRSFSSHEVHATNFILPAPAGGSVVAYRGFVKEKSILGLVSHVGAHS